MNMSVLRQQLGLLPDLALRSHQPRQGLLELMTKLKNESKDCSLCTGTCCSFVANSMQITPLEAFEIYDYLLRHRLWTADLKAKFQDCIEVFRLDKPLPGDGRRSFGRRTYTCPFYAESCLGCPLPPSVKPYGCLAFNPIASGVRDGEACRSYTEKLEQLASEVLQSKNDIIRQAFAIDWLKKPIPVALLALDNAIQRHNS